MRRQMELFLCAVQFLTRLPVPRLSRFHPDWTTRSARYFPLVGQMVGGFSALVLLAATYLWDPWIAALMAIATGVLITGGFHEDGLIDTADGLGGGETSERRLEIMKDSRIGTYGALAIVLSLALKVAALAGMPAFKAAVVLVAAHGLARAAAVVAMRLTPYAVAGRAGKWKPVPRGVSTGEAALGVLLAAWPFIFLPPLVALAGVVAGSVLAAAIVVQARRLVGGHTGDVLGAVEQLFEVGVLLGAAAVLIR